MMVRMCEYLNCSQMRHARMEDSVVRKTPLGELKQTHLKRTVQINGSRNAIVWFEKPLHPGERVLRFTRTHEPRTRVLHQRDIILSVSEIVPIKFQSAVLNSEYGDNGRSSSLLQPLQIVMDFGIKDNAHKLKETRMRCCREKLSSYVSDRTEKFPGSLKRLSFSL